MEYIKNPPTTEELISLYQSDLYEKILNRFSKGTNAFINNKYDLQLIRQSITQEYLILNISFEMITKELQIYEAEFIDFSIKRYKFYNSFIDKNPDGEFAEGEELDKGDKSEIIEENGIAKSFLLNNFCEFYLLKFGDKERLLHYLKTTKMPYAKKHQTEISKIYKSKE